MKKLMRHNSPIKLFSRNLHDETDAYLRLLKFKKLLKNNIVVIIAVVGAAVTCFFVPPDAGYKDYISYKTVLCLLSLMLVVRGLKDSRFFGIMSGKILDRISDRRAISAVLVFLPAFFALFITNDIATITFIPFAIIMLSSADAYDLIPYVVILQTMAVKLSGIVSPLGNAQNLFLIDYYGFDFFWFIKNLWPLAITGYGLTFILCMLIKPGKLNPPPVGEYRLPKIRIAIYFIMFVFIIISVFDVLPYYFYNVRKFYENAESKRFPHRRHIGQRTLALGRRFSAFHKQSRRAHVSQVFFRHGRPYVRHKRGKIRHRSSEQLYGNVARKKIRREKTFRIETSCNEFHISSRSFRSIRALRISVINLFRSSVIY